MKAFGKSLMSICFLINISLTGFTADTLKINLTYKYKLDKEGHTLGYNTVNQKFFTPQQELFREINYNETTGQIDNYTFYFYAGGKLFTEECYNQKDNLIYILKHGYDATGREIEIQRLTPVSGVMQVTGTTKQSFDKSGKLIQKKVYFGKKAGSVTTYVYNKEGALLEENRKFKPVAMQSLNSENRSFTYDANKRTDKVMVNGRDASGKAFERSEVYSYDESGKLTSVAISGSDMPDGLIKTFKYLGSGALSFYKESNAAGKYSLVLQYEYRKHYMERGTQVSYFSDGK